MNALKKKKIINAILFISLTLVITFVVVFALVFNKPKYYTFGSYPQSLKANDVTITGRMDERGYYIGSDAGYYEKVGEEYYKVEPIKWRILKKKKGKALLVSEDILLMSRWGNIDANYEESDVRALLNDYFYYKAFSLSERERVVLTVVDNSLQSANTEKVVSITTDGKGDSGRYKNTVDKVFLLSAEEVEKYGLGDDKGRVKNQFKEYASYAGGRSSSWWLRSVYQNNAKCVLYGGSIASTNKDSVNGVVPALWVKLK